MLDDKIILAVTKKAVANPIKNGNCPYAERYRSGHNEAVLKTVCPQGRVGSNPTLSVSYRSRALGVCGEVPKLAEGTPLERVQGVNSAARVQIPPSPLRRGLILQI